SGSEMATGSGMISGSETAAGSGSDTGSASNSGSMISGLCTGADISLAGNTDAADVEADGVEMLLRLSTCRRKSSRDMVIVAGCATGCGCLCTMVAGAVLRAGEISDRNSLTESSLTGVSSA